MGASVAVFVTILVLSGMGRSPGMELLYAGLDPRSASGIMTALDQRGVRYEIRGDSIHVETGQRDALRMALAGEGLPAAEGAGYELLDSLSGFGTTSQMFDAAYWRAKEGELARTILTIPDVRSARVHISQGVSEPFRRDRSAAASVTVTTLSGRLAPEHARALRHLVASAVPALKADEVKVIDTVGGLIGGETSEDAPLSSAAFAKSEEIRRSVERLLAARVGAGRSVVEVAVELVTEREQIRERLVDPQTRVAISSDSEERSQQNDDPANSVTVASNLPDGDAGAGANSRSQSSETRERINYEISETQRELMRSPGGIRRMTVAVMVDGVVGTAADGSRSWAPRAEEEMTALRELVASAVGLDESRGDVLTLRTLEFQPVPTYGTEAVLAGAPLFGPVDTMNALWIAALVLIVLIVVFFVLRPVLKGANPVLAPPDLAIAAAPLALPAAAGAANALSGDVSEGFGLPDLPVVDFMSGVSQPEEDPATRLRRLIDERQAESIEILRGWLDPEEERA